MAYINQDTKKLIHAALKPIFQKYGLKASLGIDNHSTLVININKGKLDFIQNYNNLTKNSSYRLPREQAKDQLHVNHYWYNDHFNGDCQKCLHEIITTANNVGKNYDNSDIQSDYFDIGFYLDVNIGKWNKPYQIL